MDTEIRGPLEEAAAFEGAVGGALVGGGAGDGAGPVASLPRPCPPRGPRPRPTPTSRRDLAAPVPSLMTSDEMGS